MLTSLSSSSNRIVEHEPTISTLHLFFLCCDLIEKPILEQCSILSLAYNHSTVCTVIFHIFPSIHCIAMLQADDEDDAMDQQMKSPFGSSFRTFDATEYKPIGRLHFCSIDLLCSIC